MPRRKAEKAYHHGNLRDALIAAAERLMAEGAGWTFTLREVARTAGVSHNAPYSHFPDRLALLAAVASRSFADLSLALAASVQATRGADAAKRLRAAAGAYVGFAFAYPARYRLMFSAELSQYQDAALKSEGAKAFAVLQQIISDGVAAGPLRPDPDGVHALSAWSLVHGLSLLLIDGKIPISQDASAQLVETVASRLIDGLAKTRR